MQEHKLSDPVLSPETEAFWAASAEGRFLVKHCRSCGKAHWYPRSMCPFCASFDTEWRPGSGRGTVYTFSVMRRAGDPFVIAYVELAEGPRMMTHIVECDPQTIRIGDAVTIVFRRSEGDYAVPCFKPSSPGVAG
jgi:uncharacterized OB-fold protein